MYYYELREGGPLVLINIFFQNEQEKLWIANKVEESTSVSLSREEKKHFAALLMKAKVIIAFAFLFYHRMSYV